MKTACIRSVFAAAFAALLAFVAPAAAQQVAIDNDDIGGVVRGPGGPEAGVWVIAETRELPVRFIRSVVTDDQGRYVIPDLPKASYDIWVRGYGLVDSPKVKSEPGKQLNLTAVPAPNDAEAARYYPAIYWYAMMKLPDAEFFGSKDAPPNLKMTGYLNGMKNNGCVGCHQLGQLSTRTIPKFFTEQSKNHEEAWVKRVQAGQAGENMVNIIAGQLGGVPFKYLADWTERVQKGELPFAKPTRPEGVERNIVVTLRDWHNDKQYLHDLIASDRRYPTVNAYGPLFGQCEHACDDMPILDPVKNVATNFVLPTTPDMPLALGPGNAGSIKILGPSAYWGEENIWDSRANNHNSMFDRKGRLWLAATGHKPENPDFCKKGSSHPSAVEFPLDRTNRRVTMYDPKTGKYTAYQTCFGSHHLQFGYDANETLWMSTGGGGGNVGWINTRMLDETGDIEKSQGWTSLILDTNGNGQRDEYTEPGKPQEPGKDMRIGPTFYAVMPSPADGSVWGTIRGNPGAILRVDPGKNPHRALAEMYNVPLPGFGPRGGDIDKQGRVWVSLASGHMGVFDRRLCKGPLNGPNATGDHCPEGWAFYQYPGPGFKGIGENSAESSYYSWVDQHNTFGLGDDIPMSTANLMDGLVALKDGKMISIRVPYPLGFYAKGFDGRIDDPNAGWKGRGLWAANGDRTPWLIEGGKGTKPLAAHFQLRPDPLAK
ncbi:MAG: carboxypeptidase regulatory-like domain-containing protein [Xanthobacteraceae bacterium]|nr:carboxypeptidase regulatory-like domain-containing protein [Xanthobacteraceae bacterium]